MKLILGIGNASDTSTPGVQPPQITVAAHLDVSGLLIGVPNDGSQPFLSTDFQVNADMHASYARKFGNTELSLFFELFNMFNTANFGASYSGNASSVNFRQPTGFMPSIGYPRQLQIGSRFLF